jgi:hypothetical protein
MNVVKMQRNARHYFVLTICTLSAGIANAQSSAPVAMVPDGATTATIVTPRQPIKASIKEDPTQWVERVKARAQARWQLIAEKKYDASHAYLSTASRAFLPLDQYTASMAGANYADGVVGEVECVDDACNAAVLAFVLQKIPRIAQSVRTPLQIRERWIAEDGEAYLLQR